MCVSGGERKKGLALVFFGMAVSPDCSLFKCPQCVGISESLNRFCFCARNFKFLFIFLLIKEQREVLTGKTIRWKKIGDMQIESVPGSSGVLRPWLTTKALPHSTPGRYAPQWPPWQLKQRDESEIARHQIWTGPLRFCNVLILTNLLWTRRRTCRVSA